MRRMLFAAGVTLALAAASAADARSRCTDYAHDRKVTGTVVGALGGALLGGAVAGHGDKGKGALIGAGAGAVVGNQVSRVHCRDPSYAELRRRQLARARASREAAANNPRYAATGPVRAACRYESRPYYDQTGRLIYAPIQVCE
jgi:uncharacterized protein YcfJ